MKTQLRLLVTIIAALTFAGGCVSQTQTEREFGDAVRAVSTSQIYDMGAAQYPDKDPVTGGHPDRIENAVRVHADGTAQGQLQGSTIGIGVGSNR
jgi:hypothetical protein